MESKFKVGDVVKLDLSAKYSGQCCIAETMRGFDQKEYTVSHVQFGQDGKPRYQLSSCGPFYFVDEWLTLVKGNITIPVSEFKRIHDIACSEWKGIIYDMVKPFAETVTITEEFAETMIKAATQSQKPVVLDVLKNAGYFQKSDEYFSFDELTTITTLSVNGPLFIRQSLASERDMRYKELGFSCSFTPILVDKEGNETKLTYNHHLKFKKAEQQ